MKNPSKQKRRTGFVPYKKQLNQLGEVINGPTKEKPILPYEIPPETGLMIDTEFEFQIAEMIASGKIKI